VKIPVLDITCTSVRAYSRNGRLCCLHCQRNEISSICLHCNLVIKHWFNFTFWRYL